MNLDKKTVWKLIGIVAVGVLFAWTLQNLSYVGELLGWIGNILWPLVFGFCIAFVLNLPMRFFERHLFAKTKNKQLAALRRPLCIVLSIVAICAVLALVIWLVVPELVGAVTVIVDEVPVFLGNVQKWLVESDAFRPQVEQWIGALQIDWNATMKKLLTVVTESAGSLLDGTVSVLSGIFGSVFNFIMAFIFALYILLGKETLKGQFRRMAQAYLPQHFAQRTLQVLHLTGRIFENFVFGQVMEACILGTLCWLGMGILRLPYATMIGALVGFTALIPIVGAWAGAIVGAFMIGMQSFSQAVIFIVFLLLLQQIEGNVIYPRVVGSSVGLPAIWVLASITVGGSLMGIAGMLFAVPVCSILYSLTRTSVNRRLERRQAVQQSLHEQGSPEQSPQEQPQQ